MSYQEPAKRQVGRPEITRRSKDRRAVRWDGQHPALVTHTFPPGCRAKPAAASAAAEFRVASLMRLRSAIDDEARKLIRRFENYARQLADESERRARRTTRTVTRLALRRPPYWSLAPGFDPYFVRARNLYPQFGGEEAGQHFVVADDASGSCNSERTCSNCTSWERDRTPCKK
jgi:hypothetical protein